MTTETQTTVIPEKSKGQIFKEKNGFSKTFKRNMQRNGFNPYDAGQRQAYRKYRNATHNK